MAPQRVWAALIVSNMKPFTSIFFIISFVFYSGCVKTSSRLLDASPVALDSNATIVALEEIPLLTPSTVSSEEHSHLSPFLWIMGVSVIACFIPLLWNKSHPYRLKLLSLTRRVAASARKKIQERLKK